jgi:putative ATPase
MPGTVSPRCQNSRIERLFDLEDTPGGRSKVPAGDLPLAARMRPRSLGEFVGQDHLLGRGSGLRTAIEEGRPHSMILYGPPGTGKTTLARLLAVNSRAAFEEASAVNAGRAEVREVLQRAQHRRDTSGERTIFFLDEIHRFNKAQQDTLLPAVEEALVVLVGATTENPYFEVNSALLSRCRVYELRALDDEHVLALLRRSLGDERGIAGAPRVDDDALEFLAARSAGDARTALSALELACETVQSRNPAHSAEPSASGQGGTVSLRVAEDALQRSAILYDKGGDLHYDLISAWIKATRGSDPDASLLYLAAMLEGGEDPRFIARRMVIFASEDIGNADPRALEVAVSTAHAVEHVGMPECALNLSQAAIYLAIAPKSNASIKALGRAREWVREHGTPEPPAALRSAAYPGAKKLGRGLDYDYPHDHPEGVSEQELMPDEAIGERFLELSEHGEESDMRERLERIRRARRRGAD